MENEIIVNGRSIPFLKTDSEESFLIRVATVFETLPEFITVIGGDSVSSRSFPRHIKISLLTRDIEDMKGKDFKDFMTEKNIINKYPKVSIENIIKLWTSLNRDALESDEFFSIISESEMAEYGQKFNTKEFLTRDWKNFMSGLEKKISDSSENIKRFLKVYKKLDETKEVEHLDFRKEKSEYRIRTNITEDKYSLARIFSILKCNEFVPFASFNDIYKIFNDDVQKIQPEWEGSFETLIFLKVLESDDGYTDASITFLGGEMNIDILVDYSVITLDKLKKRLLSVFSDLPNFLVHQEIEESITGMVLFPEQSFETYVMSDFIMNNDYAFPYFAVEESLKTTKKKTGLFLRMFNQPKGIEEGTCSVISKKVVRGDSELRVVNKKRFLEGSDFIRLRINKVKSMDIAMEFVRIFSKLLNIYKAKYQEIVEFYRKYIPDFSYKDKEEKEIERKPLNLRDQVPDLFYPGYSRKCPNSPEIIGDDEIEAGTQIMKFPKTEEEGPQYNYICKNRNDGYNHIGLRVNNLKNKDDYAYIPCCFKTDQRIGATPYMEYYEGKTIKKGQQQNILKTNRLAPWDEFAELPKNIGEIFFAIDPRYGYSRKGVHKGSQSFLDCVLEGAFSVVKNGVIQHFAGYTPQEKTIVLNEQYKKLVNYPEISVASQENPGETPEEMRNILRDKSKYMDPRRWVKLCETIYKCKIYIFSRKKGTKADITLETPFYDEVYLSYSNSYSKTLFIYEHWGGESDQATYPQCELIVKWDKLQGGDTEYNFSGKIPSEIEKIQKNYFKQFWYSQYKREIIQIKEITIPKNIIETFTGQIIDSKGKARAFMTREGILLFTDPLPPLNLPLYQGNFSLVYSPDEVINFSKKYGVEIVSQFYKPNPKQPKMEEENFGLIEVNINLPIGNDMGILLTVKTNGDYLLPGIPLEHNEKYPNMTQSISKYHYVERISFLLVEYFEYMFSQFVYQNQTEMSLLSIKKFLETKITIKKADYILPVDPGVSMAILQRNNFVDNFGNLIVDSQETLRKLVYSLRLSMSQDYIFVRDYHTKSEVKNFYVKNWKDPRITSKNNSVVQNFNIIQKISNYIYPKIQPEGDRYFLNWGPDNKKFLIMPTGNDLEKSQNISKNWQQFHRVSDEENIKDKVNTKLYIFKTPSDFQVKKIVKKKAKKSIDVVTFRKNGKIKFSSMLKLT